MSNSTDNSTNDSDAALEESSDEILELDEEVDGGSEDSDNDFDAAEHDTEPIEEPVDTESDSGDEKDQQDQPDQQQDQQDEDEEILKPEEVPSAAVVTPGPGDRPEATEVTEDEDDEQDASDDSDAQTHTTTRDDFPESIRTTDEMDQPDKPGDIESVTSSGIGGTSETTDEQEDDSGGPAGGLHETIQMEALDRAAIEREGQFQELESTQPVLDNRMAPEIVATTPKKRVNRWPQLDEVLDELESPASVGADNPKSASPEQPEEGEGTGRTRRPTPAARPAAAAPPESAEGGGSPPPTEGLDEGARQAEQAQSLADAISDATNERKERPVDPTSDTAPAPAEAVDPGAAPQRPEVPEQEAESLETPDWMKKAFSEHYLLTVSQDVQRRTARQADFIENSLSLGEEDRTLDLACGFGRHTIELASRGYQVVGFDQSKPLLERAVTEANRNSLQVNFIHGDMRALQFENVFDACFCWQTSFGYFDDETNLEILRRLNRALQPGGQFLLQVVNRDYVVQDMPHRLWWEGSECVFLEEGEFDPTSSLMHLERSFIYEDGRQPLEHDYFVRIYSLHELRKMLQKAGFETLEVSGAIHYRGDFLGKDSPHIIIRAATQ